MGGRCRPHSPASRMLPVWLVCLSGFLSAGAAGRPQEGRGLFSEHGCCKRQVHHLHIGRDLSGSPVRVDVGLCGTYCGGLQGTTPHALGFLGLSKQASMLDFLRSKKDGLPRPGRTAGSQCSCPLGFRCEPSSLRGEELLLLEGVRQVEVIEGCQCRATPTKCLRLPALKTLFPDSPLEQTLDVGKCSGPPRSEGGLFCVPTDFDLVPLKSPSGYRVVRTVGSCAMREACYRVPHMQHYLEVSLDAAGEKKERLKEIDVGRCLGRCVSGSRCLLGDQQTQTKCRFWAKGIPGRCAPHQYETHTFRIRTGELRTVLAVQTCTCGA